MRKKTGIRNLVFLSLLVVLGIVFTFFSFDIPFTTYTFVGFSRGMNLSYDIGNGANIVLNTSAIIGDEKNYENSFDETYDIITKNISSRFQEYNIQKNGRDSISVTIPYSENNIDLLDVMGTSHELKFTTSENGEPFMTGDNIIDIVASKQMISGSTTWGVVVSYDDEGREAFANLEDNSTVYIYLDETLVSSMSLSSAVDQSSIFISGSMDNEDDANIYACRLLTGKYKVNVSSLGANKISPTYGENTLLYIIIATIVAYALILILFGVIYKWQGVMADLTMILFSVMYMFILSLIPHFVLSMSSLIAMFVLHAIIVISLSLTLEKIKKEYALGKKLNASVKTGFKKALVPTLDLGAVVLIVSILLAIFAKNSLWVCGIASLVGILLSAFMSLLVFRAFEANLVAVSKKSNGLGMKRLEGVNEIA